MEASVDLLKAKSDNKNTLNDGNDRCKNQNNGRVEPRADWSEGAKRPKLDYCTHNVINEHNLVQHEHPHIKCYQVNITKYSEKHFEIVAYLSDEPMRKNKAKKKKSAESREEMNEIDLKRSASRAKKKAKQKAIMLSPNYFLTLTYPDNMIDPKKAWSDFDKLRRKLSNLSESFDYVAVQEKQKRGAIHFHILYRNFINIRLVRYHWNKIVGAECMINVRKVNKGGHIGKIRVSKYLAKYITKDLDNSPGEINSKRYSASKGIPEPEKQTFYMPYSPDPKAMEYQLFKIVEKLGKIRTNKSVETEDWHLQFMEVY